MPLRLWQREVERRMACSDFGDVEDWINGTALREDVKSALWLLAWSMQETDVQRTEASDTIRDLEAMTG